MTKRIYLIDCPGIVYDPGESDTDKVLKSVVRSERIPDPDKYIGAILDKTEKKHIADVYGVYDWVDVDDFIKQLALKTGKLLKGGEPDINNVSKSVIMDWQRGNIPFFEFPPKEEEEIDETARKNQEIINNAIEQAKKVIKKEDVEELKQEEIQVEDE